MYISIHSLCSMLCWCTFGSNYSLKSFWIWCHKLGTPIFGQFCPFLFAAPLKLHQVGWEVSVRSHFQISPEMFNRIKVCALAGPLKDIHRVVLKPFFWYFGCVFRVVVLLKNEPSPQSEVKSALEQVHTGCLCTLLQLAFPLSWLVSQLLPLKNTSTAWCCHHHASL